MSEDRNKVIFLVSHEIVIHFRLCFGMRDNMRKLKTYSMREVVFVAPYIILDTSWENEPVISKVI